MMDVYIFIIDIFSYIKINIS